MSSALSRAIQDQRSSGFYFVRFFRGDRGWDYKFVCYSLIEMLLASMTYTEPMLFSMVYKDWNVALQYALSLQNMTYQK